MKYFDNDYELLYLIDENNEKALEIMIEKYKPLIWRVIRQMHIQSCDVDDYLQEGIICLYKAIKSFDCKYSKTFTRYFELIWRRRIVTLLKDNSNYEIIDDLDFLYVHSNILEEMITEYNIKNEISLLNDFDRDVYLLYFVDNYSISAIAEKMNVNRKKIYNTIEKIKRSTK